MFAVIRTGGKQYKVAKDDVIAEILAQGKGEKVVAFKKKRRKNTHRKRGHRQPFTKIKITGIEA